MKAASEIHIHPEVGAGIYTSKDVARILKLPPYKVSRSMRDFWENYSFGIKGNSFINFKTLIEFYTFYHLRENGFTSQKIKKIHEDMAKELSTLTHLQVKYILKTSLMKHQKKQ